MAFVRRLGARGFLSSLFVVVAASCAESADDAPAVGAGTGGLGGAAAGFAGSAGVPQGGGGGTPSKGGAAGFPGGGSGGVAAGSAGAGAGGSGGSGGSAGSAGGSSAGKGGSAGSGGSGQAGACAATFTYKGPGAKVVAVGEWNGFDEKKGVALAPDGSGVLTATVQLPPGLTAYKLIVDGTWQLDPGQGRRKYVGGVENSAIKVRDCALPALAATSTETKRPSAGAGTFTAKLAFTDGTDASGPDPAGPTLKLTRNGAPVTIPPGAVTPAADGSVAVSLGSLDDAKYVLSLVPKSKSGKSGEPLRLVFWIEAETFSWKDALIYMAVTDRFKNGDPGNDAPKTSGADERGDFQGGDLQGVKQAIDAGTLDALGVRALWLTPFNENPVGAYLASDGVHKVTGYHGYWPIKGRAVDPRIGGAAALSDLVASAHAHGIRVLMDFVANHVHESHEYYQAHKEWFRTGCVCGTAGCDWTEHALDCMFAPYLPDVNYTVPEVAAQFVSDGVHWIDQFDLDGLRVDAVKHVEEIATRNLAAEVREAFEPAGTRHFLMGETAMGWTDGDNSQNYGTIAKYIGPFGLDGQFDFVLYHGVSYRTFAYGEKGMLHADYWTKQSVANFPADAIMTPYIGSHDTARFTTLADPATSGKANNQWSDTAGAPGSPDAYARTRVALAWLLGLPGAPLLYYGDEYGQWGGVDPNNRTTFREGGALSADETATLAFVRKAGKARQELPALRRGVYVSLYATEDTLVFGRKLPSGEGAIVALTRSATPVPVKLAAPLSFTSGTKLVDRLGGPDSTVAGDGSLSFTVPAKSAAVLAP